MTGNRIVRSADLKNVGHDYRLKNSYIGSCMTDFNQTFIKMIQLELATKASADLDNVGQGHISHISAIIKLNWKNVLHWMMTPLSQIIVLKCTGPHFFNPDNYLLYIAAPHKPAIYLRFTTLVNLHICTPQTSHLLAVHQFNIKFTLNCLIENNFLIRF